MVAVGLGITLASSISSLKEIEYLKFHDNAWTSSIYMHINFMFLANCLEIANLFPYCHRHRTDSVVDLRCEGPREEFRIEVVI